MPLQRQQQPLLRRKQKTPAILQKKKVLIVDDSKTIRDFLCRIIQQDPKLEVVGQAEDPLKAELLLHTLKPDVITLDIHMPRITGVQWLTILIHGDDGKNHAPVAAAASPVRKTVVKSNPTAKKSNVVHLKSNKAAKQSTPTSSVAVGAGGAAPDRDHDGFKDI